MGPRAVYASMLGKQVGGRHSMEGAPAASTLGQHSSVSVAAVPELARPGWVAAVIQNTFVQGSLTVVCRNWLTLLQHSFCCISGLSTVDHESCKCCILYCNFFFTILVDSKPVVKKKGKILLYTNISLFLLVQRIAIPPHDKDGHCHLSWLLAAAMVLP